MFLFRKAHIHKHGYGSLAAVQWNNRGMPAGPRRCGQDSRLLTRPAPGQGPRDPNGAFGVKLVNGGRFPAEGGRLPGRRGLRAARGRRGRAGRGRAGQRAGGGAMHGERALLPRRDKVPNKARGPAGDPPPEDPPWPRPGAARDRSWSAPGRNARVRSGRVLARSFPGSRRVGLH